MPKIKMDEEMKAFAADVAESIAQIKLQEPPCSAPGWSPSPRVHRKFVFI
ncbi:hypothetical protein [Hydrogenophaga sp.]|nr:hypothetical protein [Hydrogenophaga sp.]MDO9605991.1 hypothetical protein [Hydrogenophaga sp.]